MLKKEKRPITPEAFKGLETVVRYVVREELTPFQEEVRSQFHQLQQTVDGYLKQTIGWHDEQTILTARVDKIQYVMLKKKLASGSELAV
ncbi:MAG: hypothetical protein C3F02_02210 [Parcubacteria group bacterium]|nr:MAG: hypothetical protein C3F02_02210 [Parcubacteria group bacterium]